MEKKRLIANVERSWEIKEHALVAPAVLIKQGVMCGSAGCVLWKKDVIKASVEKWEGVPVVLNHPKIDGQFVSVNETPNERIGRVTNPKFDSFQNCIRADIEVDFSWVDENDISSIMDWKEVSVGVFGENESKTGEYYTKHYEAVATSMMPDHLALLKGEIGACSWEDGCGIRVNNKCDKYKYMENEVLMPTSILDGKQAQTEIDVNSWEDSDILPPCDVALLINRAKNKNRNSGGEDEEILMPTSL